MTLSDLAKFSMTPSNARSLCDSWASCLYSQQARCFLTRHTAAARLHFLRLYMHVVTVTFFAYVSTMKIHFLIGLHSKKVGCSVGGRS